jgi:integrase/recombinase XerD
MNAWPDVNGDAISRYLRQLRLRTSHTARIYRGILSGFQRLVEQRGGGTVDLTIIVEWLRERARHCKEDLVEHQARVCSIGFSIFSSAMDLSRSIPWLIYALSTGLRGTPPIVRALLGADAHKALEAVRCPPPFASFLGDFLRGHAELMRALGRQYSTQTARFLRFDRFLQGRPDPCGQFANGVAESMGGASIRPPLTHISANCSGTTLPGRGVVSTLTCQCPALIRVCGAESSGGSLTCSRPPKFDFCSTPLGAGPRNGPHYGPLTLYTMLVLAYCAGLRLGEIVHLDLGDVDLTRGEIAVRNTKFFKSRTLPLAPTVVAALRDFVGARHSAGRAAA